MKVADLAAAFRARAQQVGGRYSLQIDGLSAASREKLQHLAEIGDPFFAVTDTLKRRTAAAVSQAATRAMVGKVTPAEIGRAAGEAIKTVVLLRFREQGGDVHLRPSPSGYRAAKAKRGLDTRVGIATGALLTDLQGATFLLRKQ